MKKDNKTHVGVLLSMEKVHGLKKKISDQVQNKVDMKSFKNLSKVYDLSGSQNFLGNRSNILEDYFTEKKSNFSYSKDKTKVFSDSSPTASVPFSTRNFPLTKENMLENVLPSSGLNGSDNSIKLMMTNSSGQVSNPKKPIEVSETAITDKTNGVTNNWKFSFYSSFGTKFTFKEDASTTELQTSTEAFNVEDLEKQLFDVLDQLAGKYEKNIEDPQEDIL